MHGNLLLYYDILGFKHLEKTMSREELREIVDTAVAEASVVRAWERGQEAQLDVLYYSDTVLLWSHLDGHNHRHHMALWTAGRSVFLNLMAAGIPTRAAVVHGRFTPSPTAKHIDEIKSEPALQEAHQYAEVHMSKAGLMGIVVAPSLSHLWSDDKLAPLVAIGCLSGRGNSGEFYLNPFVSLTDTFQEHFGKQGYSDTAERRRQIDEQTYGALAFLLREQERLKRESGADLRVLQKYDNTLTFVRECIGKDRFDEACLRCESLQH